MGLEDGWDCDSAQHTNLAAVTKAVCARLQIPIWYLSTGPTETNLQATEEEISDKSGYGAGDEGNEGTQGECTGVRRGITPCTEVTFAVILSRRLVPSGCLTVPGVVGVTVIDTGIPAVVVVTLLHFD